MRTFETLKSDYQRFTNDGGNDKGAKNFNNAIVEPLFTIPIERVCNTCCHSINVSNVYITSVYYYLIIINFFIDSNTSHHISLGFFLNTSAIKKHTVYVF